MESGCLCEDHTMESGCLCEDQIMESGCLCNDQTMESGCLCNEDSGNSSSASNLGCMCSEDDESSSNDRRLQLVGPEQQEELIHLQNRVGALSEKQNMIEETTVDIKHELSLCKSNWVSQIEKIKSQLEQETEERNQLQDEVDRIENEIEQFKKMSCNKTNATNVSTVISSFENNTKKEPLFIFTANKGGTTANHVMETRVNRGSGYPPKKFLITSEYTKKTEEAPQVKKTEEAPQPTFNHPFWKGEFSMEKQDTKKQSKNGGTIAYSEPCDSAANNNKSPSYRRHYLQVERDAWNGDKYALDNLRAGLLDWCQNSTKDYKEWVNITDFDKSWRDGLALCSLFYSRGPPELVQNLPPFYAIMRMTPRERFEQAAEMALEFGARFELDPALFLDWTELTILNCVSEIHKALEFKREPKTVKQLTSDEIILQR